LRPASGSKSRLREGSADLLTPSNTENLSRPFSEEKTGMHTNGSAGERSEAAAAELLEWLFTLAVVRVPGLAIGRLREPDFQRGSRRATARR
jgi:hypothetical protein